ncbi:hypothetical protein CMUS01_14738 [Colletotrichum musicola]|uniref:Uncharacterized protein n=1 Tax=Colletotrichum musicola TaxID=2175873 RepID=A0A8H6J1T4_9PEZI|nr:hypothetical protein CMUS01_14738 [Colletotrichum musicola]
MSTRPPPGSDVEPASAQILSDLYPGTNYEAILITVTPPPTLPEPSPRGYRVPYDLLGRFANTVHIRPLAPVAADAGPEAIEQAAILLTETLGAALRAVGKAAEPAGRGRAKAAGWWSPDCKETRDRMLEARRARSRVQHPACLRDDCRYCPEVEQARRDFLTAVRTSPGADGISVGLLRAA